MKRRKKKQACSEFVSKTLTTNLKESEIIRQNRICKLNPLRPRRDCPRYSSDASKRVRESYRPLLVLRLCSLLVLENMICAGRGRQA